MDTIWFLVFLYGTSIHPLPMDDFASCVINAAFLSGQMDNSVACISPRANGVDEMPVIFTNGTLEPQPNR